MVRHDYKLVQQIFSLHTIVEEDIEKEACHSVRLKCIPLLNAEAVMK